MPAIITNPRDPLLESIRRIIGEFWKQENSSRGVLLKPNIVFPVTPSSGEITRQDVVRSVIKALREIDPGIDIVIGEGTAAGTNPAENFRVSGYAGLAREMNVDLIDFDKTERFDVPWRYGKLGLPKVVLERYYINLPILKLSSAAGLSGAMKNQKGLLSTGMKKKFHLLGLHEPIAELAKIIRPDLNILDGRNFFEGNVIIAGESMLAMDRLAAKLLETEEPEYLKIAKRLGSEETGDPIPDTSSVRLKKPFETQGMFKERFNIRLWSNPRACSMCRLTFRYGGRGSVAMKLRLYGKLLKCAIRGTDFVFGLNPEYDPSDREVICFGDCTRKLAMEKGHPHIPGCPPTREEMVDSL